MKNFSEMSKEEFAAVSPFDKKSCYDCNNLKSALSYWCGSKEAIKARGTSIPGCTKCPFWEVDWSMIEDKYKTEENGYVKIIDKIRRVKPTSWFKRIFKK